MYYVLVLCTMHIVPAYGTIHLHCTRVASHSCFYCCRMPLSVSGLRSPMVHGPHKYVATPSATLHCIQVCRRQPRARPPSTVIFHRNATATPRLDHGCRDPNRFSSETARADDVHTRGGRLLLQAAAAAAAGRLSGRRQAAQEGR